jgi:hypothetical protein
LAFAPLSGVKGKHMGSKRIAPYLIHPVVFVIVEVFEQLSERHLGVFLHVLVEFPHILRFEERISQHLVGSPLNLGYMQVKVTLRCVVEIGQWIKAQQIETDEVGYDIFP